MGYRISNIMSISPDDTHKYFLYFLPGGGFKEEWINVWVENKFSSIASKIGPNGVFVIPHEEKIYEYLSSILNLEEKYFSFSGVHRKLNGIPSRNKLIEKYRISESSKSTSPNQIIHNAKYVGYYNYSKPEEDFKFNYTKYKEDPEYKEMEKFDQETVIFHYDNPSIIFSQTPLNSPKDNFSVLISLVECKDETELAEIFDKLLLIIKTGDISELDEFKKDYVEYSDRSRFRKVMDKLHLKPNIFGLGVDLNKIFEAIGKESNKKSNKKK